VISGPEAAEPHLLAGIALAGLEDPKAAIPELRTASRLKPDSFEALESLGSACVATGRYREALEPLNRAIELRPNSVEAHDQLGVAYFKMGNHESALAEFQILEKLSRGFKGDLKKLLDAEAAAPDSPPSFR
jgi:tetratricopeptide (TPR) repeat protein